MNPSKVIREKVNALTDLPNIGKALAKDLVSIGIESPLQLQNREPLELYKMLCQKSGERKDPCVLDVFMSITDFMNGAEPKVWWDYTQERKDLYKSYYIKEVNEI